MQQLLQTTYTASGAIAARRIVRHAGDGIVQIATSATDLSIGVSDVNIDALSGERVGVVLFGKAEVVAGAAIVRGVFVTSDATGRAVTAAPAAGVNARCIGIADASATAAGDIIDIILSPTSMQG